MNSPAWALFDEISPDIALLQEVGGIPIAVAAKYQSAMREAAGNRFNTAILVRGAIGAPVPLTSAWEWVNRELAHFKGNLLAHNVTVRERQFRLMSVYSPAWPVDRERLREVDVEPVKLKLNPDVWVTELMWAALRDCSGSSEPAWIVGGDLNASETFDARPSGPRGNREILDRMDALGFTECLRRAQGRLVPTFRNPSNGQIVHQMDHMFVSNSVAADLVSCSAGDHSRVFNGSLSDHLPIVADFRDPSHRLSEHLTDFISQCEWTFAKTYADTWPHEYIVRNRVDESHFVELVTLIRAHGYEERFYDKLITYFEQDGMVYWTMGFPIEKTIIVNRCRKEQTFRERLKNGTLPEAQTK